MSPERLAMVRRYAADLEAGRGDLCASWLVPLLLRDLAAEVERLRRLNEGLVERVAGQAEVLSRRAER